MYIIGLGNPGDAYANTPHNAGFLLVDEVARRGGCPDFRYDRPMRSYVSDCGGWLLGKPQTYMNRSGDALRPLLNDRSANEVAAELVVIHDDVDQPLGSLKIVERKNAGGHRGVTSLTSTLGTNEFVRIKIGVAPVDENGVMRKPSGEGAVRRYLLSAMSNTRKEALAGVAGPVYEALRCMDTDGVAKAMSLYNG